MGGIDEVAAVDYKPYVANGAAAGWKLKYALGLLAGSGLMDGKLFDRTVTPAGVDLVAVCRPAAAYTLGRYVAVVTYTRNGVWYAPVLDANGTVYSGREEGDRGDGGGVLDAYSVKDQS